MHYFVTTQEHRFDNIAHSSQYATYDAVRLFWTFAKLGQNFNLIKNDRMLSDTATGCVMASCSEATIK